MKEIEIRRHQRENIGAQIKISHKDRGEHGPHVASWSISCRLEAEILLQLSTMLQSVYGSFPPLWCPWDVWHCTVLCVPDSSLLIAVQILRLKKRQIQRKKSHERYIANSIEKAYAWVFWFRANRPILIDGPKIWPKLIYGPSIVCLTTQFISTIYIYIYIKSRFIPFPFPS